MSDAHAFAHQFASAEQQKEVATLGMWTFLVTEVMMFGGLFGGYAVYRSLYPDAFMEGSHHLDVALGGLNTLVLIASSLTMALAVHSAHSSRWRPTVWFLLATIALGLVFLGVKVVEYSHKIHDNLVPGPNFQLEGAEAQVELFFSFYFAMTGLHAVHMIIGVGILAVLVVMAWRGSFSEAYYAPVELTGLYWHFVDIVWIFLFPLLYLIGAHVV